MRSLYVRLLALLTIALLPLGLIAVYQTFKVVKEAEAFANGVILEKTLSAARRELGLIQRAHGVANALGTAAVATEKAQCEAIMRLFVSLDTQVMFAGFVNIDGAMQCSSNEGDIDFSDFKEWQDFPSNPRPMVAIKREGTETKRSVVVAIVPIYSQAGTLLGASSVSLQHSLDDDSLGSETDTLEMAVVNQQGEILYASTGIDNVETFDQLRLVPAEMNIPQGGSTLWVEDEDARLEIAIVPLLNREIYLVGRWTASTRPFSVSLLGTATPVFPVIMWLMSLFVAFFAIDRLVLQYLKKMRARMAAFTVDDLSGSHVTLENAPSEIAEIADSYNHMINRIAQDHEDLAQSVREKDILLKEIHHRVKNNLQLIASILNMQLRQIEAPEAKAVLRRVQDRVMSLATIHKSLYIDENVEVVQIDRLITEIVNETLKMGTSPTRQLHTSINIASIELDPDQAVPLSLLVAEAITNAVKYASHTRIGEQYLSIELSEPTPSEVRLTVHNSRGSPSDNPAEGTGLGAQLIEAFVQQLGGELEVAETDTSYALDVRFPKLENEKSRVIAA